MGFALVSLLGDHGEKVQVVRRDLETGFFPGLADGTFERGFADGGLQLAADGAPDAKVGRLRAQEQQMLSGGVFQKDQNGDFVSERWRHAAAGVERDDRRKCDNFFVRQRSLSIAGGGAASS